MVFLNWIIIIIGGLFGKCLCCKIPIGSFDLCYMCKKLLVSYNKCFHDKECNCGRDVIPYVYNHITKSVVILSKYADVYYSTTFIANSIINNIKIKPDYIVPIPTSSYKLFMRGYNPAVEIAKIISYKLNIPIKHCFIKTSTTSQKGSDINTRKKNVQSMLLKPNLGKLGNIAIIDDIISSGSTINRAIGLISQHADNVYIWSFAKV